MPAPGEDILVTFLDERPEGFEFERSRETWPLHITVVSWFETGDEAALDGALTDAVRDEEPFPAQLGEQEMFGADGTIPVNPIAEQPSLMFLHRRLSAVVVANAVTPPDTTWAGDAYRAHVTQHGGPDDRAAGDTVLVDSVYRVRLLPGNICRVMRRYHFGDMGEAAA